MRIVTRPDFDGIVCAVLLKEVEPVSEPIKWVQPSDMQKGLVEIRAGDIIANLPHSKNCRLWFDHHITNRPEVPFEGAFELAPSAAGIVYRYYAGRFKRDYGELVTQTDRIDSADLTADEVLAPENYPYFILSMTIRGRNLGEAHYWNLLVDLMGKHGIDRVMTAKPVRDRCAQVVRDNRAFESYLKAHTHMEGQVAVTDFRSFATPPDGNRFLVYSLFPDAVVSVRVRYHDPDRKRMVIGVGHSIFNRNCNVNVGQMLSRFGGGGHRGAGSTTFDARKGKRYLQEILEILTQNQAQAVMPESDF